MIHHPARCPHHNVHATAQGVDLRTEVGAPVNRQHLQMRMPSGIGLERISHLHGQFAGGCQHEGLRGFLATGKPFEQRQREGRRFSGAGLGLAHQVTPQHQFWEGRLLNR